MRKLLYSKINVTEEMEAAVSNIVFPEKEYDYLKELVWNDPEAFCRVIRGSHDYRRLFLHLYLHFAADAYELYRQEGIADEIYYATMQDIVLWTENCQKSHGEIGIEEYEWLWRHVTLKLFRLGRLQFERTGENELNLHIPQGESLDFEECRKSIEMARNFFTGQQKMICHSWLLNPEMGKLLSKETNIMRFQTLFHVYKLDDASRQAEERVFGVLQEDPENYPEHTELQKKLKEYLKENKEFGSAYGEVVYA